MANPLRKTMVYLGLADEEFEYQEATQAAPVPVAKDARESSHTSQAGGTRASVTPLRRAPSQKNVSHSEMNEILTVHPRQYKDAQAIAEAFRDVIPVIINLSQMSEPDARRLVDFASGLSQGLYGKIERVTSKVFLLSPAHVAVSGDQGTVDSDVDASFFAQS